MRLVLSPSSSAKLSEPVVSLSVVSRLMVLTVLLPRGGMSSLLASPVTPDLRCRLFALMDFGSSLPSRFSLSMIAAWQTRHDTSQFDKAARLRSAQLCPNAAGSSGGGGGDGDGSGCGSFLW